MTFVYTIKSNRRARGVRISVHADGRVVVTKSVRVSRAQAALLVEQKMNWILEKIREMEHKPKKLLAHYSVSDFHKNKERAYALVEARIAHFNQFYRYSIGRIAIRNQKTRWGSCSGKKNLNFNYKIVFLPPELQDYLIVHELCHLGEMNHAKRFWDLVAQQVPNYQVLRRELRKY